MYDDTISKARKEAQGLNTAALNRPMKETYRVVLDGVKSEIETPDSFSIKFSLSTHVPVTKIKHLMQTLPAVVWKGQNKKRSSRLLSLIEEAGGRGRIVLEEAPEETEEGDQQESGGENDQDQCQTCGFRIKEGETFCSFCMTQVEKPKADSKKKKEAAEEKKEAEGKKTVRRQAAVLKPERKKLSIPPWRLFIYLLVVLITIVGSMISSL